MKNHTQHGVKLSLLAVISALVCTSCGEASSTAAAASTSNSGGSETKPVSADIEVTEFTGDENIDDIRIEHISGSTYEGWMMLIHDPSDITVEVNPNLASGGAAPDLDTYMKDFNAVAGINAGGFIDVGGHGDGSQPQGIVIHKGQLVSGSLTEYSDIIGIDSDNKLVCAGATAQDALSWGVQEAVTFGPIYINNYEDVFDYSTTNLAMLNPRTAIGQAGDGTFLLLVIDGRGPSSFGAEYGDVVKVFQAYDAINAANLDGGNSSAMMYNGEYVNNTVSMYGSRNLPTVFLVKEGEGNN